MIPNFKTYINESVWGNISKRAEGTLERKEDLIDRMNNLEFLDYLKENYETKSDRSIHIWDARNKQDVIKKYIFVPILHKIRGPYYHLRIEAEGNRDITIGNSFKMYYPNLYKKLKDDFHISQNSPEYLKILPKNGCGTSNSFFLQVIDYIIDNADDKYEVIIEKK